jgi:alpha-ketoglutarate-dependent taurine dioxygenase
MDPSTTPPFAQVSQDGERAHTGLPHIIYVPTSSPHETSDWLSEHSDTIRKHITSYGAVLLRGVAVTGAPQFREIFSSVLGAPITYTERSSPRLTIYNNVYSSTEYRSDRSIFLHNEQSYNSTFVRYIGFYCAATATSGGETPLADTRRVLTRIDPAFRAQSMRQGYIYRRAFGFGLGPSWQEAFGLSSARELEDYCDQNDIDYMWMSTDHARLVTQQKRPVVARHPISSEMTWFNHMTFFNFLSLEPELRDLLQAVCRKEEYPNSTLLGDGSEISAQTIKSLREAYLSEETTFEWAAGDILLIDNMLVAHGRRPFTGPRKVLVAMSTPTRWKDVMI